MSGKTSLLVFWMVVAFIGSTTTTATDPPTTTATDPPTTTATDPPTTTATDPPTTTATDPPTTTATDPPTTTATDPPTTTATDPPTTTATDPPTTTATDPPTTTATDPPTTTATDPPTTTATGSTTTTATGPPTTTKKPDPCEAQPCGAGIQCEPRGEGFVCLCPPGENYNNTSKVCVKAKVFPGTVDINKDYSPELENKTTKAFKDLEIKFCNQILQLFKDEKVKPEKCLVEKFTAISTGTRSALRSTANKVQAIYQLLFKQTDVITDETVTGVLGNSETCKDCDLFQGSSFVSESLCEKGACEERSTDCSSSDGDFECTCKEGYTPAPISNRVCLVACPNGEYLTDEGCKRCPFGWSGFNCNESWKLALVIVGSVFGGLLLVSFVSMIIVARRPSTKGKKAKNEGKGSPLPAKNPIGTNGYLNRSNVQQQPKMPFPDTGPAKIPRTTINSSWDTRTNLEMTPSNSRHNLLPSGKNSRPYEEINEMNPYTRSQNMYSQVRPGNPYSQNRANINPYSQNQGRTNPYYMDDDRRFQ